MGSDERELEELLRIKKRRLAQLKRQAANLGYGTPPELRNEIEDLEKDTNSSSQVIDPIVKGELPDDIMAALRAYGVPASVNNALQLVEAAIYELKKAFQEHRVELHDVRDKVITLNVDVRELTRDHQVEHQARARGQRRNLGISLLNLVLILLFAAAVWIVLAKAGLL